MSEYHRRRPGEPEQRKGPSHESPAREPTLRTSAPAKINLGLFVGPLRERDSRHELVTVIQAISLADELTLEWAAGGEGAGGGEWATGGEGVGKRDAPEGGPRAYARARAGTADDEVLCRGLELDGAQNLAAVALRRFREATGWEGPPVRLTIEKRIPVAAGLAGGSADAAAALRLARVASGLGSGELLLELAGELGADVPAQLEPGRWLATGAGERLLRLPPPRGELGVLLLPAAVGLSTGAVFAHGDELGIGRSAQELAALASQLRVAFAGDAPTPATTELLGNDLQEVALALCPEIEGALRQATEAGAEVAFVSGSGPTVAGLFFGSHGPARAREAAESLAEREPGALYASSSPEGSPALDPQDFPTLDSQDSPALDIPVRHNHLS